MRTSNSAIDSKQAEQEALVADWLRATPEFFERYADLLNEIRLKHPHGGSAISLQSVRCRFCVHKIKNSIAA